MHIPLFMIQTPSSERASMQDMLQLWRRKFSTSLILTGEERGEGALVIASSMVELRRGAKLAMQSERYNTLPFIWLNFEEKCITYFSSPEIALAQVASTRNSLPMKHTGELPAMI